MNFYIAFSGIIGAGKTTAGRLLAAHLKVPFIEESIDGNAFLSRFYEDPTRWTFHSEMAFLIEKIGQLYTAGKIIEESSVVGDTTIYQDVFSFAKTQYLNKHLRDDEWKLYEHLFETVKPTLIEPDLIVYMKISVESARMRIAKRRRQYEKEISEADLSLLVETNETWMHQHKNQSTILTIDAERVDLVGNQNDQQQFLETITNYLSRI